MEYRTRKLVKPGDLNPRNTLFGGRLMEWVDEEAAIYATCQLDTQNIVTKYIGEVDFKSPARQGDIVEIGVETVHVGQTSITVRCVVRNKTTKLPICQIDKIVFVHVDEHGRAAAHSKAPFDEDHHSQVVS